MKKKLFLNSILKEQFSSFDDYQTFIVDNQKKLLEMINNNFFDLLVLNLDLIENNLPNLLKSFQEYNKHENVIAYYDKEKNL